MRKKQITHKKNTEKKIIMGKIGIIGGSGLYNIDGIERINEILPDTPYGHPSAPLTVGKINNKQLVFLPRHGKYHQINPSEINYRANIYAMKLLGVDKIISISACGSLKEDLRPTEFVIPDQFVDRTNQSRKHTFFEGGIVAHISFAHPVCEHLAKTLYDASMETSAKTHYKGTYLNMEGPQFSTLAESNLYRSWGMDIVGMTNMTEAQLSREAEICYVSLAAITDYDCWHPNHESVTVEAIMNICKENVENSQKILKNFILKAEDNQNCSCHSALNQAIVTDSKFISPETKIRMGIIIEKYIK